MALTIPSLATRTANDLPATEQHPTASERFRSIPSDGTTLTDLGAWRHLREFGCAGTASEDSGHLVR